MDTEKIIQYLSVQGVDDNRIAEMLSDEVLKRNIYSLITDYEEKIIRNGLTRKDAFETFSNLQRIKAIEQMSLSGK